MFNIPVVFYVGFGGGYGINLGHWLALDLTQWSGERLKRNALVDDPTTEAEEPGGP